MAIRGITPNAVTATRVMFGAAAIGVLAAAGPNSVIPAGIAAIGLTLTAIALDGVDGWLARRMKLATQIGAQIDVLGDRILENLYFIFFAASGQIAVWVPVIFFVRGAVTDFLRGVAAQRGADHDVDDEADAAFRKNWMLRNRMGIAIVASRLSRGAYAAMKCASFCALAVEWMYLRVAADASEFSRAFHFAVLALVGITTAFCVLRALPVIWEARKHFESARAASDAAIPRKNELEPQAATRASRLVTVR